MRKRSYGEISSLGMIAVVLAASVSGCNKRDDAAISVPSSAEEARASDSEARRARSGRAEMMGGYVPAFGHRLRSQRQDTSADGRTTNVAVIEYQVPDDRIVELLRTDLEARRLNVSDPAPQNGIVRIVAQNSRIGRMTADINPKPALELRPGAEGIVRFSWAEIEER